MYVYNNILDDNKIGAIGAKQIANKLNQLTYLDLGDNKIGVDGAKQIGNNLINLTELYLSIVISYKYRQQ